MPASGQLAFDFGQQARPPPSRWTSDNVYFAVLPDPDAALRMKEIGNKLWHRHGLPGRVQPARLLHVSLAHVGRFAGGVPESITAAARVAGSAVRCEPFDACIDHAASFDNPRGSPVVLGCGPAVAGFAKLRRAITAAMLHVGFAVDPSIGLTPHVTLVYNGRAITRTLLADPIAWTVREFVLVRSLYGQGRHVHLGRWQLGV